ncbi:MAG: pyridoxine 5'-phosphate synthase [Steroidobacteraceae bacterium]|nr:pyridoxine 5'-phosphate synthase [Steroidobacteraceae bacterium]MDW8260828.1 pyridoxine 5'-phosphate synthase [Gammaproteobacteria bacterium]
MAVRLSVNVNKIATLRNARGGNVPDLLRACEVCVAAGAGGITVHPRADERHIRRGDVYAIKRAFADRWGPALEYNIEGDPRPDWLELVGDVKPQQATLVPVRPGEITSEAGWNPARDADVVARAVAIVQSAGVRASVFVEANDAAVRFAKQCGADRVELYTGPFAQAYLRGADAAREAFERYARAARLAHSLGLGVNAGHDLDLNNLALFAGLPHLDEVSIGHALISEAVFRGLERVVRDYLAVLRA